MKREKLIEDTLGGAYRNGYSYSIPAIDEYAKNREIDFRISYDNIVTFNEKGKKNEKVKN